MPAVPTESGPTTMPIQDAQQVIRSGELDVRDGEFLSSLVHALQRAMTPLQSGLHSLGTRMDDPVLVARSLETMRTHMDQLSGIVDELANVVQFTGGRFDLRTEPTALDGLVERVLERVRRAASPETRVAVSRPESTLWVEADPHVLGQGLEYLFGETLRSGPAELAVTVERQGPQAVVTLRAPRGAARRSVLDANARRPSLGVAMVLARALVERHGGTIEARGDAPEGAGHVVRLPAASEASPDGAPREAAPARALTVVVVDDNPDAVESLVMLLEFQGHRVVGTAHDGRSAIDVILGQRPDVVFLDIGLPVFDGYEVARRVRGHQDVRGTCLAAVTGYGLESDRLRSRDAGFDFHLVKPVEPEAIAEVLASVR